MSQDGRPISMGGGTSPVATSDGWFVGASGPSNSPITLAIPRPENERSTNLYVDTPFQHKVSPRREEIILPQITRTPRDIPLVHGTSIRSSLHRPFHAKKGIQGHHETTSLKKHHKGKFGAVSTQPTTLTYTKRALEEDSIICGRCGRCRCEACSTPRPPSGAWACGGKCHISPNTAVDYISCLCCVKGILYHCSDDEDSSACDRPCSCSGNDACLRWACLALSTLPLPCLLCYWPLTGVKALCEKTYQRFSTQGCRCGPTPMATPQCPPAPPEKRLLNDCM